MTPCVMAREKLEKRSNGGKKDMRRFESLKVVKGIVREIDEIYRKRKVQNNKKKYIYIYIINNKTK